METEEYGDSGSNEIKLKGIFAIGANVWTTHDKSRTRKGQTTKQPLPFSTSKPALEVRYRIP